MIAGFRGEVRSLLSFELPPWSRNLVSRVSKHPRNHLVDTGLAAHLLGMTPDRLAKPTAVATGPLVETFAVNELVRQVSRFADALGVTLYHYRTHGSSGGGLSGAVPGA